MGEPMTSSLRRAPCCVLVLLFVLSLTRIAAGADSVAPAPAAPTAPESPAPSATRAATGQTMALVVNDAGAQTVMGLAVQTAKGEDLGHVVDVVADRNGVLLAAIVDFGGFLGVGSRKIAVDWRSLHFPRTGPLNTLVADLPLDQLRSAPPYKPGETIVIMGAPAASAHAAPPPAPSPAKP
jgi:hypothetical protein